MGWLLYVPHLSWGRLFLTKAEVLEYADRYLTKGTDVFVIFVGDLKTATTVGYWD